jgi:hypothetical protein
MSLFTMQKILKILLLILLFVVIAWVIIEKKNKGKNLDIKLAGSICAKLVYENIDDNFFLNDVEYREYYSLRDSIITLYLTYSNGFKTSVDCLFERNYKDIIKLKEIVIINPKGNLNKYYNIEIKYLQ